MRLFIRLLRRRSRPCRLRTGELEVGVRRLWLMVAAAWSEDKGGERGDGGPAGSAAWREMRRGRCWRAGLVGTGEEGDGEDGREFRSGGIVVVVVVPTEHRGVVVYSGGSVDRVAAEVSARKHRARDIMCPYWTCPERRGQKEPPSVTPPSVT